MADTPQNQPPTPPAEEKKRDPLDVASLEETDRLDHASEVAAIMTEIRALTGQSIARTGTRRWHRLWRGAPERVQPIERNLSAKDAEAYIPDIITHLYAGSRHTPYVDTIQGAMQGRFRTILAERESQGGAPYDQVRESITVGRALLDAVYEHIKETDLERVAANIASQVRDPIIRNRYVTNTRPPHLHDLGIALLERLRKDGANPGKVILAFSAALDTDYVDPQVDCAATVTSAQPRLRLGTDLLRTGEANINQNVYRHLQRIAETVETYLSIPKEQLSFTEPVPPTGVNEKSDVAQTRYQENLDKYNRAVDCAGAVQNAVRELSAEFGNFPPLVGTTYPSRTTVPATMESVFGREADVNIILNLLAPNTAVGRRVPTPETVRNLLARAVGGNFRKASDYKTEAETTDQNRGITGTDACNKILAEYTRRVGGVDEQTAKRALASLTGRVKTAEEMLRVQRAEFPALHPAWDARKQTKAFNNQNKGARWRAGRFERIPVLGRIPLVGTLLRYPSFPRPMEFFIEKLNQPSCVGLNVPGRPMSPANSLDDLTVRYYTLWHLTHILPDGDEKKLPLTQQMTTELMSLRRAIVERHVRNISVVMQRKGIDKLKKEDVEKMGLQGSNIEDLPFDEIQDRLYGMLGETTIPEKMKQRVEQKVGTAWAQVAAKKDDAAKFRQRVIRVIKWPIGEGSALNPITWPAKAVRGTAKGLWKGGKAVGGAFLTPIRGLFNHLFKKGGKIF